MGDFQLFHFGIYIVLLREKTSILPQFRTFFHHRVMEFHSWKSPLQPCDEHSPTKIYFIIVR